MKSQGHVSRTAAVFLVGKPKNSPGCGQSCYNFLCVLFSFTLAPIRGPGTISWETVFHQIALFALLHVAILESVLPSDDFPSPLYEDDCG